MNKKTIKPTTKQAITPNPQQPVYLVPTRPLPTSLTELSEEDLFTCSGGVNGVSTFDLVLM